MRNKYIEDLGNSDIFDGIPEDEMYRLFGLIIWYSFMDNQEYMSLKEIEDAEAAYDDHPSD